MGNYMLRRQKHSKIEFVTPKEEEEYFTFNCFGMEEILKLIFVLSEG
jgi:hypothetical protein